MAQCHVVPFRQKRCVCHNRACRADTPLPLPRVAGVQLLKSTRWSCLTQLPLNEYLTWLIGSRLVACRQLPAVVAANKCHVQHPPLTKRGTLWLVKTSRQILQTEPQCLMRMPACQCQARSAAKACWHD